MLVLYMIKKLEKLYKEYGFIGRNALYTLAKKSGLNVTMNDIVNFLDKQEVHQIHTRKTRKQTITSAIVAPNSNFYYQMDLLDMQGYKGNEGYNYVLMLIDIFDRRLCAKPLKTKRSSEILPALQQCIRKLGRKPVSITSDNGGEFLGSLDKWLTDNNILHITARVGDHNQLGIIDRVTRTLKEKMYKSFTADGNYKWKSKLASLVNAYNHTPHSALLNLSPVEAHKYAGVTVYQPFAKIRRSRKQEA